MPGGGDACRCVVESRRDGNGSQLGLGVTGGHVDVLIICDQPFWPLDQCYRICGYHMTTTLRRLGVNAAAVSVKPLGDDAPAALEAAMLDWPAPGGDDVAELHRAWRGPAARLHHRMARYRGIDREELAGVITLVDRYRPRVVIGLGPGSPLVLSVLACRSGVKRIWCVTDELVNPNLSGTSRDPIGSWWSRVTRLSYPGALERLFVGGLDGVVGASATDTQLSRLVAGACQTITIPQVVDGEYFAPGGRSVDGQSLVFWGRMDCKSNVEAARWFATRIWPHIRVRWPEAALRIVGNRLHVGVVALGKIAGVEVVGEVADIRPYVQSSSAAILPMRCGGGINKLIEAAAMGKVTLASPRVVRGLQVGSGSAPMLVCRGAGDWCRAIGRVWSSVTLRSDLERRARQWVQRHHTWDRVAARMLDWIEDLPTKRRQALGIPRPHMPCTDPAPLRPGAERRAA